MYFYNKWIQNQNYLLKKAKKLHGERDIKFDCNHYYLIIEVDEYKHRGANYKCDKQRMYDIIAKLGLPCIFIRYNPDDKKSDKNILLDKVKKYLDIKETEQIWDDYGYYVEYLFY